MNMRNSLVISFKTAKNKLFSENYKSRFDMMGTRGGQYDAN